MTVVKELNELAYKMTGVNPKAKTDAQALNYIEQNYNGGDTPTPQSKFDYVIPGGIYEDIDGVITDTDIISVLEEISSNGIDENGKVKPLLIGIYLGNDDQGVSNYFTIVSQLLAYNNKISLYVNSEIDTQMYKVTIGYNSIDGKWHYYSYM